MDVSTYFHDKNRTNIIGRCNGDKYENGINLKTLKKDHAA